MLEIREPPSKFETFVYFFIFSCRSEKIFKDLKVKRIVNCTHNIPNFHEKDFLYHSFQVGKWRQHYSETDSTKLSDFVQDYINFISEALEAGDSVLVHCLAGAHRAGTAGIIVLMYLADINKEDAEKAAKLARPVIEPIGGLKDFICLVETRKS